MEETLYTIHSGFGRWLTAQRLLPDEVVSAAEKNAATENSSLDVYLIKNKIISADFLAEKCARDFNLPLIDLAAVAVTNLPIHLIPFDVVSRSRLFPLYHDERQLWLVISDPTQQNILTELKFLTGLECYFVMAASDRLGELIQKIIQQNQPVSLKQFSEDNFTAIEKDFQGDIFSASDFLVDSSDEAPIIAFIEKIIATAIQKKISDIHFEPYEKNYRIRLRQDGVLYELIHSPMAIGNRIASRVKVMGKLDISERRLPQDGRFKFDNGNKQYIDFRVSTCPTVFGEKIVLRLLDSTSAIIEVDQLGFNPSQKTLFLQHIKQPQGLILVTGPTGSGKTITLYTALRLLNSPRVNILTAEEPVEIQLPGINQVNIHNKIGLDFAKVLRAFLRQDPDIIMIGEIRDLETAEIAAKAAQTGHLVFSTVHTNSAAETFTRLMNVGLPLYTIATSMAMIIAQRLVRKLCENCKRQEELPLEILLQEGFSSSGNKKIIPYKATGCENCHEGYCGRTGIFELLPVTDKICELILAGNNAREIFKAAVQNGMKTLHDSALEKVRLGLTSLSEIKRVIQG